VQDKLLLPNKIKNYSISKVKVICGNKKTRPFCGRVSYLLQTKVT
jgi:hypothetical protein